MSVPEGAGRSIKVGVMCDGRRFPAWQAEALHRLMDVPGVVIALLIVRDVTAGSARTERRRDPSRLLWNLFDKRYVERRSRASRTVDLADLLAGVPDINCPMEPVGGDAERFADDDLEAIVDHGLDVILRFGSGILNGGILTAARYGVWSFHHGDERSFRGCPPGFWELVEGQPVVGAMLYRLTERLDDAVVLHRGYFKTTPQSYRRTRDDVFLGSAVWPSVVVRQVLAGDTDGVVASPSSTDAPIRRDPSNGAMVAFLLRQAWAFVRSQFSGLMRAPKWTIGVADTPIHRFLDGTPAIRWLEEQPGSRYLADPFGIEREGRIVTLVEDYDHATRRGVISVVDPAGGAAPVVVLDAGLHASYPYLVEHGSDIYCVPETFEANEVRLYRSVGFPLRWELVGTLVEGFPALDATVFRHGGRWWLFCTRRDEVPNTKLHVFHAPAIEGPWEPHALNPVKTDARSARPAGTPFVHEGHLYRPAQDTSRSYGGGVTITRIDALTPTSFSEETVRSVAPVSSGRYRSGLHTLSGVGGRTLVDGRRDTFQWHAAKRELASRMGKLRPSRQVDVP